jgi:CDP-diacylglycerol--glycerol-3-phosphate 3-phosphatidyltransferase
LSAPSSQTASPFNLPNQLTALRLLLSIVVFVLIPLKMFVPAIVVFVLAASTDWIDGWYARKYNQVTKLGRVFDPFVDKIIICGTYIFLAAEVIWDGWLPKTGIAPWMAVVVMGREMLVTALRSMIEGEGGDFSAKMAGKLKMVFQCVAAVASLIALKQLHEAPTAPLPAWLFWSLHGSVWLAIFTTIYSGLEYCFAAARYLKA